MKNIKKYLFFLLVCLIPMAAVAQEQTKDKAPATSRAHKKAAKAKWKEDRRIEKANKKAVKEHHKRLQTKETRKRMKQEHRKGEKMRANKKEFFLVRWIKNLRR
jgi:hypothetical protein